MYILMSNDIFCPLYVCIDVCMCVCVCVCTRARACMCMYIHVSVCVCVCVCLQIKVLVFLFVYFRSHSADVMFNPDDISLQSAILEAVLKVRQTTSHQIVH